MINILSRRACAALAAAAATLVVASIGGGSAHAASTAKTPSAHSRAAVPWKRIGSGWQLATWAPKIGAAERLYLLDPGGTCYDVGHLGRNVEVRAWSRDGHRALLEGTKGITQYDLKTGRNTRLPALDGARYLEYSRPGGAAIIAGLEVQHGSTFTDQLERVGDDGRLLHKYPTYVRGAGAVFADDAAQTADGQQLVVGAAHGMVLVRSNGSVVRQLLASFKACGPSGSAWARNEIVADCGGALWAVPLSGAKPTELTANKSANSPYGNRAIWRYSAGRAGLADVGCGPARLVRFDAKGRSAPVDVPSPTGKAGVIRTWGHHGDIVDLTLTQGGCMQGPSVLFAYDLRHGTSRMVLGAPQTPGTVLEATPFPTDA